MSDVRTAVQFSVFLVNKPGILAQVTRALADEKINIVAMTLVDSQEHGVLRLVAENPQGGPGRAGQIEFADDRNRGFVRRFAEPVRGAGRRGDAARAKSHQYQLCILHQRCARRENDGSIQGRRSGQGRASAAKTGQGAQGARFAPVARGGDDSLWQRRADHRSRRADACRIPSGQLAGIPR